MTPEDHSLSELIRIQPETIEVDMPRETREEKRTGR
jgi:hypothetical protein